MTFYSKYIKRILSLIFSSIALVICIPLFIVIAIMVKCTSQGPVLFKQKRVGLNNKVFTLYKFRSMIIQAPPNIATKNIVDFDNLLTPIGKFLRMTSIDELPQLINIFLGNMSFIGPRPIIPAETELREKRKRNGIYNVRPGLSGLAQINGRDLVDIDNKVIFDKTYIENISLIMDVKIFIKTIIYILSKKSKRDIEISINRIGKNFDTLNGENSTPS